MKVLALLTLTAWLAACTTQARLDSRDDPIFQLQHRQVIERDLSGPIDGEAP